MNVVNQFFSRNIRTALTLVLVALTVLLFEIAFWFANETGTPTHAFWRTLAVAYLALVIRDILEVFTNDKEAKEREELARDSRLMFGGDVSQEHEFRFLYYASRTKKGEPLWILTKLNWEILPGSAHLRARVELEDPDAVDDYEKTKLYKVHLLKIREGLLLLINEESEETQEMTCVIHFPRTPGKVTVNGKIAGVMSHHDWNRIPYLNPALLCKNQLETGAKKPVRVGRLDEADALEAAKEWAKRFPSLDGLSQSGWGSAVKNAQQ